MDRDPPAVTVIFTNESADIVLVLSSGPVRLERGKFWDDFKPA